MKTVTACLAWFTLIFAATVHAVDKRPNFLLIVVDDQSPLDFKFYNPKSQLQAPTIERLARDGMVIDGAYHMGSFVGAVCTPSRHMMMCGRTVWHLPISPNAKERCPPNLELNTLPAVFNRAGYATMRTCKKGNSYEKANEQFTVRHDERKVGDTDETGSAWHAERVLEYLNERSSNKDSRPFFIDFEFSHPHDTRDGKPELLQKYGATNHTDPDTLPPENALQPALPANYLPAHPFPHGQPGLRDEELVSGVWKKRDPLTIRNEIGRYFACSENIDIQINRVLEKLQSMGELENTYIIYTADHGISIGRHGLQGKQNLYQHTWRVPFVVKGPGIQAGSRAEGNVYLLDLLASFCDLAKISAPDSNEGLSFVPILRGEKRTIRDTLYGVYCGGTKPGMRSVKQGDWKLIKYDVLDGTVRQTQLFNLRENPNEYVDEHHDEAVAKLLGTKPKPEQRNLAADPMYADKLKEMEALLLSEMRRVQDPYRLWNQPEDGLQQPTEPSNKKGKKK